MSSIEALKEQARSHEQREEWRKALSLYLQAIEKLAEVDQPDIGLYNRVGDLYIRVGETERAVAHYEEAVDLYVDAELPNNAIAVCKKIIRGVPDRHRTYLRMGQIRASQGFIVDARTNFLTYAERIQADGEYDEAFRALTEFADLVPEDTDVRLLIAEQMTNHERVEEAVDQLIVGYRVALEQDDTDKVAVFEEKLDELAPDLDLDTVVSETPGGDDDFAFESTALDGEDAVAYGEVSLDAPSVEQEEVLDEAAEVLDGGAAAFDEAAAAFDEAALFDEGSDFHEAAEDQDEASTEVTSWLHADDEAEEDIGGELPLMDFGADDSADDMQELVEAEAESPVPLEPGEIAGGASLEPGDEDDDLSAADELAEIRTRLEDSPEDIDLHQRAVEAAFRTGDDDVLARAYADLGHALLRSGDEARARAVFQQALDVDPGLEDARDALVEGDAPPTPVREVASSEEYVDLGAMILGEEPGEKTTRFRVAYEAPSGDEDADFAKMLSQFKAKVAENFDTADVKGHHDLGTAYKEMGLLAEAVEEFQAALRASADHLPTYELLGQVFLEQGNADAALRVLKRAEGARWEVEDELIGIYYYTARAHEELGQRSDALEYYDRVFSLDINFADVTDRLRELR